MKIGVMNNPFNDIYEEIRWIGDNKFDFLDLTLEPPLAQPDILDAKKINDLLSRYKLGAIGHTCYYLPYAHTIHEIQRSALKVFNDYINFMSSLNIKRINIHTDKRYPDEAKDQILKNHIKVLSLLSQAVKRKGMQLMFENTHSGLLCDWKDIETILNAVPDMLLHLDIAHAYVAGIRDFKNIFKHYHLRIGHIHISDNDGSYDQHLEIGAGTIPWKDIVPVAKYYMPQATITLEVFAPVKEKQRKAQLLSREKLLTLWSQS